MKQIILLTVWLSVTFITFILSTTTLVYISKFKDGSGANKMIALELAPQNLYQVYSSLPEEKEITEVTIDKSDSREAIIHQYLTRNKSPLADFSQNILDSSEEYKTGEVPDLWRYVIAIAQCESNLGKKIPEGSYNAWGLGIPTGAKKGLEFQGWPNSIDYVNRFLRKLIDKNLITPEDWAPTYAPPSIANGGSWAKCVRIFLDDLQ